MLALMEFSVAVTALAWLVVGLLIGIAVGYAGGVLRTHRAVRTDSRHDVEREQAIVRDSLDRLHDQMRDLEQNRVSWQSQLHQQVLDMRDSTETLRRETQTLSTALRRPQVRGRWGELHLRRTVELAGMVAHCDFTEQTRLDDGALRPDLVVNLAGGRAVVVDAKVPLDAFLDATGSDVDEDVAAHLSRHARQLRTHVDLLGSKRYWNALTETPEFVVLFMPAEAFLSAALEADPTLLEHAAQRQVVLATPTTLIALLRTVAHGWRHETLTAQAGEIHRLGRELHARLRTLGSHFDQLGRSLNAAVGHFNAAMGSWEQRVLVQARRFDDLGLDAGDLATARPVTLRAVDRRADPTDDPSAHTVSR